MSINEIPEGDGIKNEQSAPVVTTAKPAATNSSNAKKRSNRERIVDLAKSATPKIDTQEVAGQNHDDELSGDKVSVTFFDGQEDDGDKPIFCSLNGFGYQIPRGVPVTIPVEVLELFENAQTDALSTGAGGVVQKRVVKRFNYTVHGAAA